MFVLFKQIISKPGIFLKDFKGARFNSSLNTIFALSSGNYINLKDAPNTPLK